MEVLGWQVSQTELYDNWHSKDRFNAYIIEIRKDKKRFTGITILNRKFSWYQLTQGI